MEAVVHLPEIKFWSERTDLRGLRTVLVLVLVLVLWTTQAVVIVVIQQVEQRRQIVGVAWEECHFEWNKLLIDWCLDGGKMKVFFEKLGIE